MQKVITFLTTYWPVIAAMVPTLLVGLSKAPTGGSAMDWLKWVLQLFSVVTHKDQEGTFKLPLTAKMQKPLPLAAMLPLVLISLALAGCCKPGSTSSFCKAETSVTGCAKLEGTKVFQDMMKEINDILDATKGDYMQLLGDLEAKGADIFDCAWTKITGLPVASATLNQRGERIKAYSATRRAKKAAK